MLQWGRSVNAAETCSPPRQTCRAWGFNGAAALTLRKRGDVMATRRTWFSFNGAAALTLRKRGSLISLGEPFPGFNGAAALTLRKRQPSPRGEKCRVASMGPQR